MRFTQIIDFETSRLDEMLKLFDEWGAETRAQQQEEDMQIQFCQDRENPEHCMVLVTFPSYEQAMANSQREDTTQNSEMMAKLANGEPRFLNLDVLRQESS